MSHDKHQFALYTTALQSHAARKGMLCTIQDRALKHRVVSVLRVREQDQLIFFDTRRVVHVHLVDRKQMTKDTFTVRVVHAAPLVSLLPSITLCVGMTKRDALASVVYAATQMGVTRIQFLYTQKAGRYSILEAERARMHRIMIAAAEQSKQFVFPTVHNPVCLQRYCDDVVRDNQSCALYFAPNKPSIRQFLTRNYAINISSHVHVFIGPEGGFSVSEKMVFEEAGIHGYQLTPTILRTPEAVLVGIGILRSLDGKLE